MRLPLRERERDDALVRFGATLAAGSGWIELGYRTHTGAILRIDGVVAGAFDREHHAVLVAPCDRARELDLEVERYSLPTNGLPSGDGLRWKLILRAAHEEPRPYLDLSPSAMPEPNAARGDMPLWGHAHLDVAWLWDYTQARRKAVRTFANAAALAQRDGGFVFMQSQPQLYEFVREAAPELFEAVSALAREGRFDPDVAALWVEPDANVPSGESLLMHMLYAHRYVSERFGIEPGIAWLPDTFGFTNTLPTLLAHAGIPYFATTKLQWNDTTPFAHPQFRWRGPDGSEVIAAMLASYEGAPDAARVSRARERCEPVVVGYGDGGGGPTLAHLHEGAAAGRWERPRAWFERLDAAALPVHDDELYLEYHRGTYTTHHDCKARNASFERRLAAAQERLAWCIAVRAQPELLARLRGALDDVWRDVLCNQFHDVLAGAAIRDAYEEVHALYNRADKTLGLIESSTTAMLPRARAAAEPDSCAPSLNPDGDFVLDNGVVRAVFDTSGVLHELTARGGRNCVTHANVLRAYRDRPKKWDAWNLDAGYDRRPVRVRAQTARRLEDALEYQYLIGSSPLTMRVELRRDEPFVRVNCAVDWRETHVILRLENRLALETDRVTYGSAHGTIVRSARRASPAERARFEVPGQRFACASDARGGVALFALDTYGWSARALGTGGIHLGHSLLRSPVWPDPKADAGEAHLTWGYAPFDADVGTGALEAAWDRFAMPARVRLFTSEDPATLVTVCKPAFDGDGVIVRVRECDGSARRLRLHCGARMRGVEAVDALERPVSGEAAIEAEYVTAEIGPYALRSFRVRF